MSGLVSGGVIEIGRPVVRPFTYPFADLQVGQTLVVPAKSRMDCHRIRSAAHVYAKRRGVKFRTGRDDRNPETYLVERIA